MLYPNHFLSEFVRGNITFETMKNIVLSQRIAPVQRFRLIRIAVTGIGIALITGFIALFFTLGPSEPVKAGNPGSATMMAPVGSYIVNMGVMPQTVGNALKPYGLVYEMLEFHGVPVWWAFTYTGKPSLGATDFTYNSKAFKSGSFIIPGNYITPAISDSIQSWVARGVVGEYIASPCTTKVYTVLNSFPSVIIDNLSGNQNIIVNYFNNAGIPASAYRIGAPSSLTACDDIWVNPHGDPIWSTHGYLYNFMFNHNGNIWSQCHAVSMLENLSNPANPTQRLNFLTTNGLQCWSSSGSNGANATNCGVNETHPGAPNTPYTNRLFADPVMQYMDTMWPVCANGSEGWFMPLSNSAWRPSTKPLVTTSNWPTLTQTLTQQGVYAVYGNAYGDAGKGLVMYQGGHDMTNANLAASIAGQRSFLNFCLIVGKRKELELTSTSIQGTYIAGMPANLSVNPIGGTPPLTFQWTSTLQGTFSSTTTQSTVFTPALISTNQTGTITVQITDACNRVITQTLSVSSTGSVLPVNMLSIKATRLSQGVELKWSTATEKDNDFFSIQRSVNGSAFVLVGKVTGHGTSSQVHNYSFTDQDAPAAPLYYKLSQTDFDGTTVDFQPLFVPAGKPEANLSVFPNPITKKTVVVVMSATEGEAELEIWLTTGIRFSGRKVFLKEGFNSINLDEAEELPLGKSILRLKIKDQPAASSFLVKMF